MITRDYISHWTVPNAVREYVSNALDGSSPMEYEIGLDFILITSVGVTLPATIFALGYSQNRKDVNAVGTFGEGSLVSMIPLLREGKGIHFVNGSVIWKPAFEYNKDLGLEVLVINEEENPSPSNNYSVIIDNLSASEIKEIKDSCIYFRDDLGEVLEGSTGSILKGIKGKLFVGGIFVTNISQYENSFNFKPAHLPLNRDRTSVEGWNLQMEASKLIKEVLDPFEIAKLVEKNAPDVQNLQHRDDLAEIADVCYDNLVSKHGDDVVICAWYDEQEKLEKKGFQNVVNISHTNYEAIIKKSNKYQEKFKELEEQLDIEPEDERSPIEMLSDWYKYESEIHDNKFEKLLGLFSKRGVSWQ